MLILAVCLPMLTLLQLALAFYHFIYTEIN